jgi:hypothetical protein
VCADIDSTEQLWIAGYLQDQSPLMLVIVDSYPAFCFIRRAEDAVLSPHRSDKIHRGISSMGSPLAETEGVYLLNFGYAGESETTSCTSGIGIGMIEAVEGGEPQIPSSSRRGVKPILTSPIVAASRWINRDGIIGQREALRRERGSPIGTAVESAIRERYCIERP